MSTPATSMPDAPKKARRFPLLVVLWGALVVFVGIALARGEALGDRLALPVLALFITTALLGSRLWSLLLRRPSKT